MVMTKEQIRTKIRDTATISGRLKILVDVYFDILSRDTLQILHNKLFK